MLLLLITFIAGILTVLAPCVLPLLPVIVGGSLTSDDNDKKRPYIIAGSLMASIIVFTLVLKVSTALINLPPTVLTDFSGGLVIALGLASLFPSQWEELLGRLGWQAAAQRFLGSSQNNASEYVGPVLIGVALGPVFSTCSPTYAFILASVLPRSFGSGFIYLISYCIGIGISLLAAVILGKRIIKKANWVIDTHGPFRRICGGIFVLIGIIIITGRLLPAEIWVANHLPFSETRLEQRLLNLQVTNKRITSTDTSAQDSSLFNVPGKIPAPELTGLTSWENSQPLKLADLKGKVVLVDFWTYSCVNCLRAIPYVEKWYETYKDKGFVVIGVHTPEFAFEHLPDNVASAVKAHRLTYPIAQDNDYGTWNAFGNNSWPADYLIDREGNVRDVHLGEGDYDKSERSIQALLGTKTPLKTPAAAVPFNRNQTPETYLGSERAANFVGSPGLADGSATYQPATKLEVNNWTLGGNWQQAAQNITSSDSTSTLTFHTRAKDVYVVASSPNNQPQSVGVQLAGGHNSYGKDVSNGQMTVAESRLYHVVSGKAFGESTVTLTVPSGVSLYAFTFGS